jgi:hypothetical protein
MKGVAMSAGRHWIKELYVGFLLLILSFLYLSHLSTELRTRELGDAVHKVKHGAHAVATVSRPRVSRFM